MGHSPSRAKRIFLFLPIILIFLLSFLHSPFALTLDDVIDRLQATYHGIKDLSGTFHQVSTLKSIGQSQEAWGLVYIKKPGKMRWEYKGHEARLVVTDGHTLWVYSPDSRQAIVQEVSEAFSSELPLIFLAGKGNLRADFEIRFTTRKGKSKEGAYLLDLSPKRPDATLGKVSLEVNPVTFLVEKATIYDVYTNTTVISFQDQRMNAGLEDSKFIFNIPPGVDVLEYRPMPSR